MNTALNKKYFSHVIPSILAFALSGVYTIVDGFFIGRKAKSLTMTLKKCIGITSWNVSVSALAVFQPSSQDLPSQKNASDAENA